MNMAINEKQYLFIFFNSYRLTSCVLFISLFILNIGNTQADDFTIQVDFFFDTQAIPGRTVVGYRLLMGDESICEVGPVDPQTLTCSFTADAGTYDFSLSAIYNAGTESRPSNKFTLSIGDIDLQPGDINGDGFTNLKDIIIGMQILQNSYTGNITLGADVNNDNKIGLEEILFDLNKASLD